MWTPGNQLNPQHDPSNLLMEDLKDQFNAHVVGSAQTVQVFEPFFKKGTVILNMSSGMGSCTLRLREDKLVGYSIAKASRLCLAILSRRDSSCFDLRRL